MHPVCDNAETERTGPRHQPVVDDTLFPVIEAPAAMEVGFVLASHRADHVVNLQLAVADKLHYRTLHHLPLRPDYDNSPLQLVDFHHGKNAVTRYEILGPQSLTIEGKEHPCTRMAYYPESGRTHQLRIHSAHPDGMDCPILGDPLYGQAANRMYLHAESLEFRHPHTGEIITIEKKAPF